MQPFLKRATVLKNKILYKTKCYNRCRQLNLRHNDANIGIVITSAKPCHLFSLDIGRYLISIARGKNILKNYSQSIFSTVTHALRYWRRGQNIFWEKDQLKTMWYKKLWIKNFCWIHIWIKFTTSTIKTKLLEIHFQWYVSYLFLNFI